MEITNVVVDKIQKQNDQAKIQYSSSVRVNIASAIETVDFGSIPGWVKSKTIKIGIHSFRA